MSNKFIAILTVLSFLLLPLHSYADKGGKGPADQAQQNANDNASFKRDGDKQDNDKPKKDRKQNKDKKKDKDKKKANGKDSDKNKKQDKKKNKNNKMEKDK